MKRVGGFLVFFFIGLGGVLLPGKEVWEEPYQKWESKDVVRVITNSPWAQQQSFGSGMERDLEGNIGSAGAGVAGDREIFHKFTVRFFSARPVREAYVRMFQIANHYDQATPEQKESFDGRFRRALNLDVSDRVIVALEYATNQPQTSREMKQFLDLAKTETLKQNVYVISERLGRVSLMEYFPPSSDGTGAKLVFPRTLNGQPLVAPEDKEVKFEFYVPVINQKLFLKFKVRKMDYRGTLSY